MPDEVQTLHLDMPKEAREVFTGETFSVYQWPQRMYDGSIATFERIKRNNSSAVVAITKEQKIVVAYQEQPLHKPFWGVLGGVVDTGETPFEASVRELKEEAGMVSNDWEQWFSFRPAVRIEWTQYAFVARNAEIVAEPHLDAGEKITLHEVSFAEFMQLIQRNDFRDTEVSLQMLKAMADPIKMATVKTLFFGA
ncbi:NUDIX hydrolase [Candidatus Woesebacteria bacterium]|nr:NUDIX hydrolase [Candidatus Woesebacteria bacterium]